ncbi:hypothetical protein ABEB36_014238 [Hypothenemus hampei]|uniref:HAUS augmin-like complex subunit 6 N-terminal domain-containing protein n=1 Tax=Hypothenemus hampei TaxID=57062 RepID=A0ABD1E3S1_HYPHA
MERFTKALHLLCRYMELQINLHLYLNPIYPELTTNNLPSYPPFNQEKDLNFRKELVAYLNVLRTKFPEFNLVIVQASQFQTPSKFEVLFLLMQLSNLAMYKHITKNQEIELQPIGTGGNGMMLKAFTKVKLHTTETQINNFKEEIQWFQQKARILTTKIEEEEKKFIKANRQLEEVKEEFGNISVKELEEKFEDINQKVDQIIKPLKEFEYCFKCIENLEKLQLEFRNGTDKPVDLIGYLKDLTKLIHKNCLNGQTISPGHLTETIKKLEDFLPKYEKNCGDLELLETRIRELSLI